MNTPKIITRQYSKVIILRQFGKTLKDICPKNILQFQELAMKTEENRSRIHFTNIPTCGNRIELPFTRT